MLIFSFVLIILIFDSKNVEASFKIKMGEGSKAFFKGAAPIVIRGTRGGRGSRGTRSRRWFNCYQCISVHINTVPFKKFDLPLKKDPFKKESLQNN